MRWEPDCLFTDQHSQESCEHMPSSSAWLSDSCSIEGNAHQLGPRFPMLEAIGDNTEGERLNLSFRILLSGAIGEDTWQFSHLSDPATVLFLLDLDAERHHASILRRSRELHHPVLNV